MGRVAIFIDGGCLEHVQKLAVDLVLLATKRQITRAVIVTGDSDFLPAIQAAKNEGVLIHLYHGLGEHRAHRDLWDAVDTQTAMTQELFKSLGARFLGYATLPGCSYHGEKETPLSGRRAGDAITGGVNKAIISITHEAVNRPSADSRERVVAYVDGFNLYFGLRQKGWRRYYWLSPRALVLNLLKPGQRLVRTKYFTLRGSRDPPRHEHLLWPLPSQAPTMLHLRGHLDIARGEDDRRQHRRRAPQGRLSHQRPRAGDAAHGEELCAPRPSAGPDHALPRSAARGVS